MRLIDAKRLEAHIKEAFRENPVVMGIMLRWIRKQPTADVAPVVHGRWKLLRKGDWNSTFICSVCGRRETITESEAYNSQLKMPKKYPYCHCGARMDGDKE